MTIGEVFHVFPVDGGWEVTQEGVEEARFFQDKDEAIGWCRQSTRTAHGHLLVHDEDAAVDDELILGEEPYLPD